MISRFPGAFRRNLAAPAGLSIEPTGGADGIRPQHSRAALRQCHRASGGDGYMLGECLRDVHDLNALPVTTRVWKGLRAGG
jgi:hypothetical protein